MFLLHTRGVEDWANEGFLGGRLRDLVCGDMRWCLLSSLNLHMGWLLSACPALLRVPRMVVVFDEPPTKAGEPTAEKRRKEVRAALHAAGFAADRYLLHAPPTLAFGRQHAKALLLQYERGMRVVVLTANLEFHQFHCKTQTLFFQDFPLKAATGAPSDSSSPFETELLRFAGDALQLPAPTVDDARARIRLHDFSAACAALVLSSPRVAGGAPHGAAAHSYGHLRLRALLERETFAAHFAGAPLVAQGCSIGGSVMGPARQPWLTQELLPALAAGSALDAVGVPRPLGSGALRVVWPTLGDVKGSLEGWQAGRDLWLSDGNLRTQLQGMGFLCKWDGEPAGRQRAMPHIKTWCRYRGRELAWLCLTSANLSKAAWGKLLKGCDGLQGFNLELGVLLLPSLERAYQASPWRGFSCTSGAGAGGGAAPGPLPGVGAGTAVRYMAWQRGEAQAPSLADGVLTVPLPLPYRLPPEGAGGAGGAAEEFWVQPDGDAAEEQLGLDCFGLAYGAHASAGVLRKGLTDGSSWQRDVVSVLQRAQHE